MMKKALIVIPAYNEEKIIDESIRYLYENLPSIKGLIIHTIIAENGSKDKTFEAGRRLEKKFPNLKTVHFPLAGRDNAIQECIKKNDADIFIYLDADMSTHPKHIADLIYYIEKGNDIVIGSRSLKKSKVIRPLDRKIMSMIYNFIILPVILPTGVGDTQCGFKAINKRTVKEILRKLTKGQSFMDTELLAVAHSKGYKIKEIPVEWTESERASTMSVHNNIPKYLRNIFKVRAKIHRGFYN